MVILKIKIIKALYIPLTDHYAALIAFDRYREEMIHGNFRSGEDSVKNNNFNEVNCIQNLMIIPKSFSNNLNVF